MQDDRQYGPPAGSNGPGGAPEPIAPEDAARREKPVAYLVLARKYRPSRFEDLIGQEAMVRTLTNAFALDRIHQAYLLTGVRGVGKTTTARILARAFNYDAPAREGRPAVSRPTITMDEPGVHCQAIIESRHVDVIEMDAASHTGIDDVREIIDGARYKPVMARFKVYIIDEVHMLSKQAFNGLLKTLEEPPDHVKFVFATTEIEKVPVTVRSRCQRFDLRRVEAATLAAHLAAICASEAAPVEEEALALIARAAEGSVRDALSLLDQAIAHGARAGSAVGSQAVTATEIRAMLGLADHGRIIDLFEHVMRGRIGPALAGLKDLYDGGADPAAVLVGLAEFTHLVTRLKLAPEAAADAGLTPQERARGGEFAGPLSVAVLTRAWQLLSRGLQEVRESPTPLAAADMVLVRVAYAADLPTPDEALRRLAAGASAATANSVEPSPTPREAPPAPIAQASSPERSPVVIGDVPRASPAPALAAAPRPGGDAPTIARFEDVVALAGRRRDIQLKLALERDVRLVRFEDGSIEFSAGPQASPQLAQTLMRRLQEWTGRRWMVVVSNGAGRPTLKEQADALAEAALQGVRADPLVRRALEVFPGAEIVAVRSARAEADANEAAESDLGYPDDGSIETDF